jgi:hypothetical protein
LYHPFVTSGPIRHIHTADREGPWMDSESKFSQTAQVIPTSRLMRGNIFDFVVMLLLHQICTHGGGPRASKSLAPFRPGRQLGPVTPGPSKAQYARNAAAADTGRASRRRRPPSSPPPMATRMWAPATSALLRRRPGPGMRSRFVDTIRAVRFVFVRATRSC